MPATKTRISMSGGSADAYLTHPSGAGPFPGVLFFMDALGWRQTMFDMADRIAAEGYCVLLPNVFWREGPPRTYDIRDLMAGNAAGQKVIALIGSLSEDVITADTRAYLDFFAAQPQLRPGSRVATTGYCMGGGLSMCVATTLANRVAGAASFHGGAWLTAADTPGKIAKNMKARVYIAVAETDRRHTPEVTAKLKSALEQAEVPFEIETYAGASHGFAVKDHVVYDAAAAEKHWQKTFQLLRETVF